MDYGYQNGTVVEWNAVGAAISPAIGFSAGGGPIAIDANGNVWISGDGVLNELTSYGTAAPGSPFGGVAGDGSDMAIDAQSNLWIASGAGVSEFNNYGQELSPAGGFTNSGISGITAVGVDSSNNVWIGDQSHADSTILRYLRTDQSRGAIACQGTGGSIAERLIRNLPPTARVMFGEFVAAKPATSRHGKERAGT